MELTFMTDLGQTFVVEIDPNMELENVMALLEAEVNQPFTILASGILNPRSFFIIFLDSRQYLLTNKAYPMKGES
jgi:DNA damage-inducible protein 1